MDRDLGAGVSVCLTALKLGLVDEGCHWTHSSAESFSWNSAAAEFQENIARASHCPRESWQFKKVLLNLPRVEIALWIECEVSYDEQGLACAPKAYSVLLIPTAKLF